MKKYIERDEALSFPLANGQYDHKNANEHFIYGCESYREWLASLPTVEMALPKEGYWKWELADNGWADHICSVCGYRKNTDVHVRLGWSYCPHCGAAMRE